MMSVIAMGLFHKRAIDVPRIQHGNGSNCNDRNAIEALDMIAYVCNVCDIDDLLAEGVDQATPKVHETGDHLHMMKEE